MESSYFNKSTNPLHSWKNQLLLGTTTSALHFTIPAIPKREEIRLVGEHLLFCFGAMKKHQITQYALATAERGIKTRLFTCQCNLLGNYLASRTLWTKTMRKTKTKTMTELKTMTMTMTMTMLKTKTKTKAILMSNNKREYFDFSSSLFFYLQISSN